MDKYLMLVCYSVFENDCFMRMENQSVNILKRKTFKCLCTWGKKWKKEIDQQINQHNSSTYGRLLFMLSLFWVCSLLALFLALVIM